MSRWIIDSWLSIIDYSLDMCKTFLKLLCIIEYSIVIINYGSILVILHIRLMLIWKQTNNKKNILFFYHSIIIFIHFIHIFLILREKPLYRILHGHCCLYNIIVETRLNYSLQHCKIKMFKTESMIKIWCKILLDESKIKIWSKGCELNLR